MDTILRAIIGYVFLVVIVRVLARRAGGQMAMFEFVLIFLIGGVLIAATVGHDRSITNCTCAVITVGLLHTLVSWAKSRSPRFGAMVDGSPVVIYKNGEWQHEAVKHTRVNQSEVLAAARTNGVESLEQVAFAILERNGAISIIRKDS
jgi:uncharacterized membrane protein YcaP (DUF421 family)